MEQVRHQVMGDAGKLRKFTTGKAFLGRDIPAGGLRQDMLRDDVELELKDILCAPGSQHDQLISMRVSDIQLLHCRSHSHNLSRRD